MKTASIDAAGFRFAPATGLTAAQHDEMVQWLHEAGQPYCAWLWGNPGAACEAVRAGLDNPASGFHRRRITLLMRGGEHVGGVLCLRGAELHRCRQVDAFQMVRAARREEMDAIRARFSAFGSLFQSLSEDQFYLSRLGVLPAWRGRGLGRMLMERGLAIGAEQGFRRFRLDVWSENTGAISLYRSLGFEITQEGASPDQSIRYFGMERVVP